MPYPLGTTHLWAADALSGLSNSDPVGTVADSVGSKDATQSSSGSKPQYLTNRYHGFPSISHDGTNDFLQTPSISAKSAWSVVFLAKPTATGSAYLLDACDGSHSIIHSFTSGKWEYYNSPRTEIGDVNVSAFQCIGSSYGATSTGAWQIGRYSGNAFYFQGEWIAIRVWDEELDGSELAAAIAQMLADYEAPPDTTKPSDVTNLTATKISNSRVDLDSDAATDNISVAGYQTQVSTDGGSTWNTLSATTKAISFVSGNTHFPTTPGTYSLTFRRKAFDTAGTPNYSDNWSNIPTAVSITVPVTPPVASFTLSSSTVVVGGTITLTDTSTNTPTSRQWKLDEENLATTTPYALDTTGLEIGTHTIDLNVSNSGGSDDAEPQTFEVIESFLAEHFEELKLCKLFNVSDIELEMPLLEADFGDGYGAGVLSGKPSGLQKWAISADPLLDMTEYSMDFLVDGEPQTDTPFNYFWEFFRRHIALGNKPFYFVEPRTSRKFLASFVEPRISMKVFTKTVYGTGIQIRQRRFTLEGLEFRESDGSVNE